MIPISLGEMQTADLQFCMELRIPDHLLDSLIGEPIDGTPYFKTLDGDPTKSGYTLVHAGTPLELKVYKTLHTPTGSTIQYRKLNHLMYGECWEVVPVGQ